MRIVGGEWRGRPIEAPDGRDVTRPTTDRVREACASMLLAARGLSLAGARVLDAFAGSGAMGLELASRGAAWVTFVDRDRASCARVARNARALGARPGAWRVVRADAMRIAAAVPGAPFDVVVLDPPYATDARVVSGLVSDLAAAGGLADGALVLYERDAQAPGLASRGLAPLKSKRYGQTAVDLSSFAREDRHE